MEYKRTPEHQAKITAGIKLAALRKRNANGNPDPITHAIEVALRNLEVREVKLKAALAELKDLEGERTRLETTAAAYRQPVENPTCSPS